MSCCTSGLPAIGWWKEMNVSELMAELKRLQGGCFRPEDIHFTHDVYFGPHFIGQAARLEKFGSEVLCFFMLASVGAAILGNDIAKCLGYKTDTPVYTRLPDNYRFKKR